MKPPPTLPVPQADGLVHSAAVAAHIRSRLAAGGWLSFAEYMALALYAPGLGYYSAGAAKFGAAGDFITAPELSALFGRCVARQCAPLLAAGGDILEVGAGSGALALAVLPALGAAGCAPQRYWILELSADLRARQRERLQVLPAALRERVQWLERLPAHSFEGVVLANEVADALPFERFVVGADGAHQVRGVALDSAGALCWQDRPADPALCGEIQRRLDELPAPLEPGYVSEVCPGLAPWVAGVAGALARGLLLIMDYGLPRTEYYHPERQSGTLRCHYRHRAHDDPFWFPGLQDITAWVDFTGLAEAGSAAGLSVAGFCTQAAFLLGCGIEELLREADTPLAQARLASEARQLLLPGEMGESFKVMALTRQWEAPLRGFAIQDLRRQL